MKSMVLELDYRIMMVIRLLLFCKMEMIFETIFWIAVTRNIVFFLEVTVIAPVIARAT